MSYTGNPQYQASVGSAPVEYMEGQYITNTAPIPAGQAMGLAIAPPAGTYAVLQSFAATVTQPVGATAGTYNLELTVEVPGESAAGIVSGYNVYSSSTGLVIDYGAWIQSGQSGIPSDPTYALGKVMFDASASLTLIAGNNTTGGTINVGAGTWLIATFKVVTQG